MKWLHVALVLVLIAGCTAEWKRLNPKRVRMGSLEDKPGHGGGDVHGGNETIHEGEKEKCEAKVHRGEWCKCCEAELAPCHTKAEKAEEEEQLEEKEVRFTIVLGGTCLLLTYLCGYVLERHHITWFPEAGAGILIGVVVGWVLSLLFKAFSDAKSTAAADKLQELTQFDPEFFFIYLLPPIIFEAGYNMKRQAFFRNIGAICMYAFIGTTASTFIVGGMVYGAGAIGLAHPMGGLASLTFGALISATDPVTVLAVFQALGADIDLYSLVFGESVLNDAVAIVLVKTLLVFKYGVSGGTIGMAFGKFLIIFVGSFLVGMGYAAICALIMKHTHMHTDDEYLFMELCLLCCFPYMAFMTAEGLELSGIVSVLFAGIGMAHYTYNNISPKAQKLSGRLFKVLAFLAETFVFVYLGLAMFTFQQTWAKVKLIVVALVACLLARIFNIYPNSFLVNLVRNPNGRPGKISGKFQFLLWFSGLRGAVAFVLAVGIWARRDFPETHGTEYTDGDCILTTTLFIAVITVFTMGGGIGPLLGKMDALEKPEDEQDATELTTSAATSRVHDSRFIQFDRRYLKPFLTRVEGQSWNPVAAPSAP